MQSQMKDRLQGRSSSVEDNRRQYHGDRRSRTVPAYDRERGDGDWESSIAQAAQQQGLNVKVRSMESARFGRRSGASSAQNSWHNSRGGGGGGGGGGSSGGRAPSDSRVNFSTPSSDFRRSSPAGGGRGGGLW